MRMRALIRTSALPLLVSTGMLLLACSGPQHVLDPAGPAAVRIERLWWVLFAAASAVCILVTVLLWRALTVSLRRDPAAIDPSIDRSQLVWGGGVLLPVAILFPMLVYSFRVGDEVFPRPAGSDGEVAVEVIGHQYWWEVRYPDPGISTANEIRIPVGRPVRLRLTAPDVIHSFWVPRLHGKIDMVPGRASVHVLEAASPGRYRGQCAEYCGLGHALMALWIVAEPADSFDAWVAARTGPAVEPASASVANGREVFFSAGCAGCHATRGTPLPAVLGSPGPDLTDLARRSTLAAATLPNTRRNLAAWIADPERIKPGSRMPPTPLPPAEMDALLDYLESLR